MARQQCLSKAGGSIVEASFNSTEYTGNAFLCHGFLLTSIKSSSGCETRTITALFTKSFPLALQADSALTVLRRTATSAVSLSTSWNRSASEPLTNPQKIKGRAAIYWAECLFAEAWLSETHFCLTDVFNLWWAVFESTWDFKSSAYTIFCYSALIWGRPC